MLKRPIPKEIITRMISIILPPPFRCRSLPSFFFWQGIIVSFGEDLAGSTILTRHLKEMNVKTIILNAPNKDHKRILEKMGATEVVIPKREMAGKIARTLLSPKVMGYIPLAREYAIYEIAPAASFSEKSIAEIQMQRGIILICPFRGRCLWIKSP